MRLQKIELFRATFFTKGSAPDARTVRNWIENGEIDGKKISGQYFVDVDAFEIKTGNRLVDQVLNDGTP